VVVVVVEVVGVTVVVDVELKVEDAVPVSLAVVRSE
jgi:hypothetical protein